MSEYDDWVYHNSLADVVDFMVMLGKDKVLKDLLTRYADVEDVFNPPMELPLED